MNKILDDIIKNRGGNFCNVVEVSDVYDLKSVIETLFEEFSDTYTMENITIFFKELSVIYYDESGDDEENEKEVNEFDVIEYIKSL